MRPVLEGEGFRLRRASAEDVDFMVDLAAHDAVEPFMAAVSPRGREELLDVTGIGDATLENIRELVTV